VRRLLALVVAAGLVVGALAVRSRIEAGGPLLPEGSEVVAEAAGTTAAALVDGTSEADAWLVPEPWHDVPAAVSGGRGPGSELGPPTAVAASPLVLVGWTERLDALSAACGVDPVTWRCVGEQAGTEWRDLGLPVNGSLRTVHGDPSRDAIAMAVLGGAVASFFDRTDLASFDLDDPGFESWFGRLGDSAQSVSPGEDPLRRLRVAGVAFADVVGTTAAAADGAADGRLTVIETGAEVRAVLVDVGGAEVDGLVEPLRAALVAEGWRADAAPIEEDGDVPGAGFSVALQQRWDEVAR
jgi:hypothetical protein